MHLLTSPFSQERETPESQRKVEPMAGVEGQVTDSPKQSIPFVISTAIEQIRSTMSANGALLAIREPQGLRRLATAGNVPELAIDWQLSSAFTHHCLNTGRVILCQDAQEDPLIHPITSRLLNLRSAIAVPIQYRESLIGIIQLFSSMPDAFNGTHIEALQEIGELIAPVLASDVLQTPVPVSNDVINFPSALNTGDIGTDTPLRDTDVESQSKEVAVAEPMRHSKFFIARAEDLSDQTKQLKKEDSSELKPAGLTIPGAPLSTPQSPPCTSIPSAANTSRFAVKPKVPLPVPTSVQGITTPEKEGPGRKRYLSSTALVGFRDFVLQTTPGRTLLIAASTACIVAVVYLFTHAPSRRSPRSSSQPGDPTPVSRVIAPSPAKAGSSPVQSVAKSEETDVSSGTKSAPTPKAAAASSEASPSRTREPSPSSAIPTQGLDGLHSPGTRIQEISNTTNSAPAVLGAPATLPLPSLAKLPHVLVTEPIETPSAVIAKNLSPAETFAVAPSTPARLLDNSLPDFVLDRTLHGHSNWVTGVAFTDGGKKIASGSWDQSVKMWDVSTGLPDRTVSNDIQYVQALASSRDGRYLAAENSRDSVTVWDAATNQPVRTFPAERRITGNGNNWVYSIAFSPDDRILASGIDDKTVRLWNVQTGEPIRDLTAGHRSVIYVAFSPDGRFIATGGTEKSIIIWDVATGAPIRKLTGHKKIVYAVAFSPDGRFLASASADKTVRIWDLQLGREVRTLLGHEGLITTLAFSPDGRWLASGSWDKTIRIWDVESGTALQTLSGNPRSIYSIAFDPRGRWIAAGSEDGTIRLWRQHPASASRN
jgi:WD40 repeat protein